MSPFGPPVEADGMKPRSVPFPCACLLPALRTRVGVDYSSAVGVVAEAVVCAAGAVGAAVAAGHLDPPVALRADAVAYLLLLLPAAGCAVWERVRTRVADLTRYSGVGRSFSGHPRVTAFPPAGWVDRLVALEARRPRLALALARVLVPAYRVRGRLARWPVWAVKAVAEPLALGAVAAGCLLASWAAGLPLLFVGLHAGAAAAVLALDQVSRSWAIYEELRENEEASILATKLAERLAGRRDR